MLLILNEVEGMYVFNILFLVFVRFISSGVLSDIDGPQKSKIKIYSKSHATP
jgi:hypothetical protein